VFKYINYLTNNVSIGMTVVGFMLGSHWMWLGFFFTIVGAVGGAFVFGENGESPKYTYPQLLNLIMYSYFPVIVGATLVFIWRITPGDLLGIGALGLGLMLVITNAIMAHELIHRTWDPVPMFFGRWFFAMLGGILFEVEHVYGHHETSG
jgi:hypothetical protein